MDNNYIEAIILIFYFKINNHKIVLINDIFIIKFKVNHLYSVDVSKYPIG